MAGGDSRSACAPRQQKAGRNSINFCPSYRCLCDWVVVWFGKGEGGAARGGVGGEGALGGIDWQHCVPLCGSFGLATSRAAGRKLNAFPTGRRRRDKEKEEEQEERRSCKRTKRSSRCRTWRSSRSKGRNVDEDDERSTSSTWRQLAGNRKSAGKRKGMGKRG